MRRICDENEEDYHLLLLVPCRVCVMPADRSFLKWFLPVLAAVIVVWGAILGWGAYQGGERFGFDPRRGLVVIAFVLAFVAIWGALLGFRANRTKR
jgi:hypothetical protein